MKYNKLGFLPLFLVIITLTSFCCSNSSAQQEDRKSTGIDRTLYLLNTSTKEQSNQLEILFYGQSIIGGMKTNILVDSLKARFPYARITYKHKPIGGFTIPSLLKTAEHDLYYENPDLIVFHAYGGTEDNKYNTLIKNIRERMSSDVLLLDHHVVWDKPSEKLERINRGHDKQSDSIKAIAKRYKCGLVDVRTQWKSYLEKHGIASNVLMGNTIDPNVHPNDKGNELLRRLVFDELTKNPSVTYKQQNDKLRTVLEVETGSLETKRNFEGNKVEINTLESSEEALIQVLIDNNLPSKIKSNYFITRPSKAYKHWQPAIKGVELGATFPIEENWTVELFDIDRENKVFKYRIKGDKTGFDGEGVSNKDFVSNSQRIVLNKDNFNIFNSEKISKQQTPENFKVTFSVKAHVKDTVTISRKKANYKLFFDYKTAKHSLKIKTLKGKLNINQINVYRPYLDNEQRF